MTAGASATTTVKTAVKSGTAQTVQLGASGVPAGVTASFSPASVTAGGQSTLTLATTGQAVSGTYSITVTGTGPSGSHSTTYALTVTGGNGNQCTAVPWNSGAIYTGGQQVSHEGTPGRPSGGRPARSPGPPASGASGRTSAPAENGTTHPDGRGKRSARRPRAQLGGRADRVGRAAACYARPAVFCVLRVIASMTTVASSTPPVIMYWTGEAMPSRARPYWIETMTMTPSSASQVRPRPPKRTCRRSRPRR